MLNLYSIKVDQSKKKDFLHIVTPPIVCFQLISENSCQNKNAKDTKTINLFLRLITKQIVTRVVCYLSKSEEEEKRRYLLLVFNGGGVKTGRRKIFVFNQSKKVSLPLETIKLLLF